MSATTETLLQRDSLLILWELRAAWVAILLFFFSSIGYLVWLFLPDPRIGKTASRLFISAGFVQTAVIAARTIQVGGPPHQTLYECLLLFAWSTAIVYIFVERRFRGIYAAGFPVTVIACAACLYAVLLCSPGIGPLFPALQSGWFFLHAVLISISYAVFAVAFAVEISYVVLARWFHPFRLPRYGMETEAAARFHRTAHQLVLFGFPLLTFGVVSGAIWAQQAWGRYWSWNPQETWFLITWMAYAAYLHAMTMGKWRGGRASVLNVFGFVCIIMTTLGANWIARLLGAAGLHAY